MDETAHCMQANIKLTRLFDLTRWLCIDLAYMPLFTLVVMSPAAVAAFKHTLALYAAQLYWFAPGFCTKWLACQLRPISSLFLGCLWAKLHIGQKWTWPTNDDVISVTKSRLGWFENPRYAFDEKLLADQLKLETLRLLCPESKDTTIEINSLALENAFCCLEKLKMNLSSHFWWACGVLKFACSVLKFAYLHGALYVLLLSTRYIVTA